MKYDIKKTFRPRCQAFKSHRKYQNSAYLALKRHLKSLVLMCFPLLGAKYVLLKINVFVAF